MYMGFPILSVITLTPVTFSLILFLFPEDKKKEIRLTALVAASITFALTIIAYFGYDLSLIHI